MPGVGLKHDLPPSEAEIRLRESARDMLISLFGDLAGSESLTRALVAERTEQRDDAMMWLGVYKSICSKEHEAANTEVVSL